MISKSTYDAVLLVATIQQLANEYKGKFLLPFDSFSLEDAPDHIYYDSTNGELIKDYLINDSVAEINSYYSDLFENEVEIKPIISKNGKELLIKVSTSIDSLLDKKELVILIDNSGNWYAA